LLSNLCPGCGDLAFGRLLKMPAWLKAGTIAIQLLTAGIGCHGHMINYVKITSVEGLHGRALPMATGIKMANNKLNVLLYR